MYTYFRNTTLIYDFRAEMQYRIVGLREDIVYSRLLGVFIPPIQFIYNSAKLIMLDLKVLNLVTYDDIVHTLSVQGQQQRHKSYDTYIACYRDGSLVC